MRRSIERGFTLIEMTVTLAIVGVLTAMSAVAIGRLNSRSRVSGAVQELASDLVDARNHAYGRDTRTVVLINGAWPVGGQTRIAYWTLLDPGGIVDDAMKANAAWQSPADLQTPGGATPFRLFLSNVLGNGPAMTVAGAAGGGTVGIKQAAAMAKPNATLSPCAAFAATALGQLSGLAGFSAASAGHFPPPLCGVPADQGCTFCTGGVRGAVVFEPSGKIKLLAADGTPDWRGAGSLTVANGLDNDQQHSLSLVLTSAGLLRPARADN